MTSGYTTTNQRPRSERATLIGDGRRDILPMAIGYIPMAFAIGGAVASSSIGRLAGWAGGPLISAGTAQLALIDVLSAGGGLFAAVVAAIVINARLIAYSAGLSSWFAHENRRWKLLIGFFSIDATYLLAAARFNRDDPGRPDRRWYFLGMGLTLYPIWAIGMGVGVIAGASVPEGLALESAATFMMVGLLTMALNSPANRVAALAGGLVGLGSRAIPGQWAPLIAAAAAVLVANAPLWPAALSPPSGSAGETTDEPS